MSKKLSFFAMILLGILLSINQAWATDVEFDLTSQDQITTQTQSSVVFTNGTATITITRGKNGNNDATRVDNYMPGGHTDATHTRTYQYNRITFDAGSGNQIASITITATSGSYINQLTGGTWSATTTVTGSEASRTVTLSTAAQSIYVTPTGTSRITGITFTLSGGTTYTVV